MECPVEGKEVMEDGEKENEGERRKMRAKEGEGGRIRRKNKEKKRKEETGIIHGCSVTDDAGFSLLYDIESLRFIKPV